MEVSCVLSWGTPCCIEHQLSGLSLVLNYKTAISTDLDTYTKTQ